MATDCTDELGTRLDTQALGFERVREHLLHEPFHRAGTLLASLTDDVAIATLCVWT